MPAEKYLNVKTIIPTNPSSQALVKSHEGQLRPNDSEESIEVKKNVKSPNFVSRQDWMTLAILTFVNLINYMDRYTIAGKYLKNLRKCMQQTAEQQVLRCGFLEKPKEKIC